MLKKLYKPKGFTIKSFTFKKFLNFFIGNYLNQVKVLINELKAKALKLFKKVVIVRYKEQSIIVVFSKKTRLNAVSAEFFNRWIGLIPFRQIFVN